MAVKIFSALTLIFLAIVVLLSLTTALASAGASLANGVANAAASTALLTSQCTTVFMVVISLVAGVAIGNSIASFRTSCRLDRGQIIPGQPILRQPQVKQLSEGQTQLPVVYLPKPSTQEEADEALFQNWGW